MESHTLPGSQTNRLTNEWRSTVRNKSNFKNKKHMLKEYVFVVYLFKIQTNNNILKEIVI